eukprot:42112_1
MIIFHLLFCCCCSTDDASTLRALFSAFVSTIHSYVVIPLVLLFYAFVSAIHYHVLIVLVLLFDGFVGVDESYSCMCIVSNWERAESVTFWPNPDYILPIRCKLHMSLIGGAFVRFSV